MGALRIRGVVAKERRDGEAPAAGVLEKEFRLGYEAVGMRALARMRGSFRIPTTFDARGLGKFVKGNRGLGPGITFDRGPGSGHRRAEGQHESCGGGRDAPLENARKSVGARLSAPVSARFG